MYVYTQKHRHTHTHIYICVYRMIKRVIIKKGFFLLSCIYIYIYIYI